MYLFFYVINPTNECPECLHFIMNLYFENPENLEGTRVILGSMNWGYDISGTVLELGTSS